MKFLKVYFKKNFILINDFLVVLYLVDTVAELELNNKSKDSKINEMVDFDKLEKNITKCNTISNDYDIHGNLNEPLKNFNRYSYFFNTLKIF